MAFKDKEKKKQYQRKWYEANKERNKKKNQDRYKNNKNHYQALNKLTRSIWSQIPKVKEKLKQQKQVRNEKHKNLISEIQIYYGCKNLDCKWQDNFQAYDLDFHHYDPSLKDGQVSQMSSCSIKTIIEEINKCVILCAICHRRFHVGQITLTPDMICKVEYTNNKVVYG